MTSRFPMAGPRPPSLPSSSPPAPSYEDRMKAFRSVIAQRFQAHCGPGRGPASPAIFSPPTPPRRKPPPAVKTKPPRSLQPEVKRMMYGFGDTASPRDDAAALVEEDAIAWSCRLIQRLRIFVGKDALTVRDFYTNLPHQTRVYYRWKVHKAAAATEPPAAAPRPEGEEGEPSEEDEEEQEDNEEKGREEAEDSRPDIVTFAASGPLPEFVFEEDEGEVEYDDAALDDVLGARAGAELHTNTQRLDPDLADSPCWKRFVDRLRFSNLRTDRMTSETYAEFNRARETSFQTKRALFMERLPPPQLTKNVFEIMVYLSYDRIGTVVEEANRICGHLAAESSNGADTASNGALGAVGPAHPDAAPTEARALVERTEPIGVDAYAAAIKALPDLPPELEELERFRPEVDTPFPGTERRAISKAVGAARAAVKAAREGTPARKKKAATGDEAAVAFAAGDFTFMKNRESGLFQLFRVSRPVLEAKLTSPINKVHVVPEGAIRYVCNTATQCMLANRSLWGYDAPEGTEPTDTAALISRVKQAPSQLARLVEEVVEAGDCLAVVFREDPFTACNVPRIDRPAPSDARAEDKVSEQKKRPAEAADLPDEPPQKMPA